MYLAPSLGSLLFLWNVGSPRPCSERRLETFEVNYQMFMDGVSNAEFCLHVL